MESRTGSILVVHPDRKTQRALARALGATLRDVQVAGDLASASRLAPPALLVVASRCLDDPRLAALRRDAPCLVVAEPPRRAVIRLIGDGVVDHLVASAMPLLADEVTASAQKLLRGDLFGLEKYLAWGSEIRTRTIDATEDRNAAVLELDRALTASGLPARVVRLVGLIADELISNAIHNAPVDPDGGRPLRALPRTCRRVLEERQRPRLRWGCDPRQVGVEVTDWYGSIDPAVVIRHVGKAADRSPMIELEGAGAGLGLAMAYTASSQLVFDIEPGVRTEAIALVDAGAPVPAEEAPVASFHLFVTGGADARAA